MQLKWKKNLNLNTSGMSPVCVPDMSCMRSVTIKDIAVNWVFLQFYHKVLCMNGWMHLMSITDVSHVFWAHLACFLDVCEHYFWLELYCIRPLVEKEIHIATGIIETIMTALLELVSQSFFKHIYCSYTESIAMEDTLAL